MFLDFSVLCQEKRQQMRIIQIDIIYSFKKMKSLNKMNRILFSQYENNRFKISYVNIHSSVSGDMTRTKAV